MLIVAGWARFDTAQEMEAVLEAGQAMIAETRKEAGCLDYTYARDIAAENTMRIFELWKDQAALDAHFQAPHMAAFNAALGKVTIAAIDVKIYEIGGTRDLMVS